MDKQSILRMANGAIEERVTYEVNRIIDNILDPNTDPTTKRSITVQIDFKPDSQRLQLAISATAKSKLAPTTPISTALYVSADAHGVMQVVEMVPQIPGQMNLGGEESPKPKILQLVQNG